MRTPAQNHARNVATTQWDKDNTKQVKFKFNLRTDADILAKLESVDNVQGYVKALIRADIAAHGGIDVKRILDLEGDGEDETE